MCPNLALGNVLPQRNPRAHVVLHARVENSKASRAADLLQGEGFCADAVAPRLVPTVHHSGLELLQALFY